MGSSVFAVITYDSLSVHHKSCKHIIQLYFSTPAVEFVYVPVNCDGQSRGVCVCVCKLAETLNIRFSLIEFLVEEDNLLIGEVVHVIAPNDC